MAAHTTPVRVQSWKSSVKSATSTRSPRPRLASPISCVVGKTLARQAWKPRPMLMNSGRSLGEPLRESAPEPSRARSGS